jgi:hypothetical protein
MSGSRLEAPEVQFQNILRDRFLVDAIAWRKAPAAAPLLAGKRDYVRGIVFLHVVYFLVLLQQAYGGAPRPPRTPIRFFASSCGCSKGGCGARFDARAT